MAKLYFYYGAMGSSKTANALMTRFNYEEVGQKALLCKPKIYNRFGNDVVHSRIGLEYQSIFVEKLVKMPKEQVDFLSDIVDKYDVPVVCYGLRADFRNELFPGSERLLAIADVITELKTVCWCGRKATCNARYNENGIVREGAQVVLGANDNYVALCRKHFKEGKLRKD